MHAIITHFEMISQGTVGYGLNMHGYIIKTEHILLQLLAQDCFDLLCRGFSSDGVFNISLSKTNRNISVYCEMSAGGWTRIQRREDGSVNFNTNWANTSKGFGNISTEHWLGISSANVQIFIAT